SVSILEGSNDIAGMLLPRDDAAIRELLFTDFRELAGVESVNVTTVLKFFRSGHDWRTQLLSDEQVAMLDPEPPAVADASENLSEEDLALIELLLQDGRMPLVQLARGVGQNVATTRRRMESLHRRGLMHPRTEV